MDRWFCAAALLKTDPWELCRRWTPRQLDRFLAWSVRQLSVPSRADHYVMALGERLLPEAGEFAPLKFGSGIPVRKLTRKQQAEKDKRDSAMWRQIVQGVSEQQGRRKKPDG